MSLILFIFFLVPFVLFVHELGHLCVARYLRVEVAYLCVGFGPVLFSFTDRKETRWMLAALPIGGSTAYRGGVRPDGTRWEISSSTGTRLLVYGAGSIANLLMAAAMLLTVYVLTGRSDNFLTVDGVTPYCFLIAYFSTVVGLFNLLPIPPLDGWLLAKTYWR